ncbi:MAG: hypothetical protein Q7S46_11370 [Gallionella sp.]|nr:hypothetical protein [Gallionella sp.]
MQDTIFADAITNIYVTGPLVRLELSLVETVAKQTTEASKLRVSHYVVLPMDAFANAVAMQQGLVNKLVTDGVLKKREVNEAPKALS